MIEQLLAANRRFAEAFGAGGLPAPPARRLAILTCMDARVEPVRALGLELGDAHVIRNAGGRASDDALRSLVISTRLLGTDRVLVIHHTDCGMATFTSEDLWSRLEPEVGAGIRGIDFLPFTDLEASVREDVERIRAFPFLPRGILVHGLVYDVATGLLSEVGP